ncbi:MAG: SDR family oxidoreductase [Mycobacterium sp.]
MTIAVVGAPDGLGGRLAAALSATSLSFDPVLDREYSGLVIVVGADPRPSPGPLAAIDAGEWRRDAEAVPLRAMHILQRAHALMAKREGRIVVVTPTISLPGAANLVAYLTGIEGVRAMAKSAARQWAADRISLNLVAVPLQLFDPELGQYTKHMTATPYTDVDLLPSVTTTVKFLLEDAAQELTGTTITADGGSVMLP